VDPSLPSVGSFDRTVDVGWQLLQLAREGITSLEERATRVVPAETAGLIALWSQLNSFHGAVAHAFAVLALVLLGIAIVVLARLMTLRQLAKFWDRVLLGDVLSGGRPLQLEDEAEIVERLAATMRGHSTTLRRGLQLSVVLSVVALVSAGIAYAVEHA
jgi:hypothetical protein